MEGFAVLDEVDREIVQRIREAGVPGVLPKIVATDVNQRGNFALRYYDVSRRILRMNKRLHFETGKCKQAGFSVDVISEDKEISKTQYNELPIESIKIEAAKP